MFGVMSAVASAHATYIEASSKYKQQLYGDATVHSPCWGSTPIAHTASVICSYCHSRHSNNRCPNCGASQPMEKKG